MFAIFFFKKEQSASKKQDRSELFCLVWKGDYLLARLVIEKLEKGLTSS